MMARDKDAIAIIPAYNEAGTIHRVVSRTLHYVERVVVVDDGSTDLTLSSLRELPVTILRHAQNLGKAAALRRGMQYAVAQGAGAIITLDGDGQHDPADIPALLAMHRRDPAAIVVAARRRHRHAIPRLRVLAQRIADFWISLAAGCAIEDSQSGFRLYPISAWTAAGWPCDSASGFVFESEVLIEAGRSGIPIRSVSISAIYGRHLRQSHFQSGRDIAAITRMVAGKLLAAWLGTSGGLRRLPRTIAPAVPCPSGTEPRQALPPARKPRILFMAEAVTLAHVARAVALTRSLDPDCYEVHLACDRRYHHLFKSVRAAVHPIRTIGGQQFQDRLRLGDPLYRTEELHRYVEDDLRLLTQLRPDAVVGDFRLSLSVSARVAAVPYLTVTNAHWSPFARQHFVVPELAITDRFGPRIGQVLFTVMRPFVFAQQAYALNRVRRDYGLPALGYNLPHQFTDADVTLYADVPELVPTFDRPPHHHYLGPVLWSPDSIPPWWDSLPIVGRMAYVTLGTSGRADLLPLILAALAQLGIGALVSTAGRSIPGPLPPHTQVAHYLPGQAAAARADLVICNGGSATVYQALAAGKPVLGIPNNLDQYLMMDHVRRSGAGDYLRAGTLSRTAVTTLCGRLLDNPAFRTQAIRLQATIDPNRTARAFQHHLRSVLGTHMTHPALSQVRAPKVSAFDVAHGNRSSSNQASRR
ncbi:MAG: putative Dolichyl-phosphate beta-glucosyltransferase [Nitrospira sp.]|nr:MAG: putative Dolichyl-phosphate beta-glucosyltransferase [Nitrospira sp.]